MRFLRPDPRSQADVNTQINRQTGKLKSGFDFTLSSVKTTTTAIAELHFQFCVHVSVYFAGIFLGISRALGFTKMLGLQ